MCTDEAQPGRVSPGQAVAVVAIPVIAIAPWQGRAIRQRCGWRRHAVGGAHGGPDGLPVGIGVVEVDRDSNRKDPVSRPQPR